MGQNWSIQGVKNAKITNIELNNAVGVLRLPRYVDKLIESDMTLKKHFCNHFWVIPPFSQIKKGKIAEFKGSKMQKSLILN